MNKYGQAAIKAVEIIQSKGTELPENAWEMATSELFGIRTSSQVKSCPRNVFLALCETGRVNGVKSGNYTKSKKIKATLLEL